MVSFQKRSAPNVECRMSNVEDGQKTPWTLSKVPSAPIWCSPVRKKRKRKRKMKGNQICEKMTAQTENFLITYWLSRKRALCATCKKSDPAETNVSRASRVKQDSQFHTVEISFRSGKFCTELLFCDQRSQLTQANRKAVSLNHQIQMRHHSKPSRETLRSWRPTPYPSR